jgi:hypothetical protein
VSIHVRVCRDCGEEYRKEAVVCADCGGPLEDRFEGDEGEGSAPVAAQAEAAATLEGHRALFLTPRAADLVPLAERLREKGVEYRLAQLPGAGEGAPPRYALLARDADAAATLAALADLVAPPAEAESVPAVETRFDPGRGAYVQCPACGADQQPGAGECPECGLGLGGDEGEPGEGRD